MVIDQKNLILIITDNGAQLHPWWCNAAESFCKGGSDSCCVGFWSNIPASCNACKVACPGRC